jgi:hypothetical protein
MNNAIEVTEHGSVARLKSSRDLRPKSSVMNHAAALLFDIQESADSMFGLRAWRLIDLHFYREPVKGVNGETTVRLSVEARVEPT